MLKGEKGEATTKAMEILLALGDIYGATRLIPVKSAQISGVSYKNIGDAGVEFLSDLAQKGAKTVIPAFINPAGTDLERPAELMTDGAFLDAQLRIVRAYAQMGVKTTLSCTPYQIGYEPRRGDHLAWAESSAVILANSVYSARSNRESGISALCSALTGLTPDYGMHIVENRVADLLVKVEAPLSDPTEFAVLGSLVGRVAGSKVVALQGLQPDTEAAKAMGAAMASTGAVPMFMVEGFTPEFSVSSSAEKITVEEKDIRTEWQKIDTDSEPDVIALGCPHASIEELRRISVILNGRRMTKPLYVYTSRAIKEEADRLGYTRVIEGAGGRIYCDTCMVVSPIDRLGVKSIAVASAKAAYYSPSMSHVNVRLMPIQKLLIRNSKEV
jgi:predicted aconitase